MRPYAEVTKAPGQAPAVAALSAFTAAVTFLPEMLELWEQRRASRASNKKRNKNNHDENTHQVVELRIALSNVGCTACAVAVRAALEKSPLVASVLAVDVETAMNLIGATRGGGTAWGSKGFASDGVLENIEEILGQSLR